MSDNLSNKLLVAAIDFGTTYSGYAFAFRHEYEKDPLKISANQSWIANGPALISLKTPTTVLLSPDKKFHSFGYEAEDKYMELAENEEHTNWYYFRRFKMLLHGKLTIDREVEIEEACGKTMPAKGIFSMAIKFLKDHLLQNLEKVALDITNTDIHWVLTVPAIWNEPAKQFMREASVEAGICSDQLTLALEPEAAALLCKYLPMEKIKTGDRGERFGPFAAGTKYMILDLGGGTVDVTVHEVQLNGSLKELHQASGGAWGGMKVDEAYFQMMKTIFSDHDVFELFSKESSCRIDLLDLQRDFELKKRTISEDRDRVVIKLPVALCEMYERETLKKPRQAIDESPYAGMIKLVRDRVQMDRKLIEGFFKEPIESIIQHVEDVRKIRGLDDLSIILMVGGFSESSYITNAVRAAFPDLRVLVPQESGLAVVKGAVIFGHEPSSISSRLCKFTYGVAVRGKFIPGGHPESKRLLVNGEAVCDNLFSKFVETGQSVNDGDVINKEYDVEGTAPVHIGVFASTDLFPILTDDKSCTKLGEINIEAPKGGWPSDTKLSIHMGFGGPEFTVTATNVTTGTEYTASFDFLHHKEGCDKRGREHGIDSPGGVHKGGREQEASKKQ